VYTVLGGIEAVIWTDVVQVMILLGGAVLSLFIVAANVEGGFGGIVATGIEQGKFHTFDWTWDYTTTAVWVVVLGSFLSAVMPNAADQSVVQRYLTTPDERAAKRAAWTSALMGIPTAFLFFFLGTALFVFYRHHPDLYIEGIEPNATLPLFIVKQMPPGISGLVIAGIFAAAMSSVDSGMNAVSAAVVTDFYRRFRSDRSEHEYLFAARVVTVAAGSIATAVAIVVAAMHVKDLLDLFFEALGLFGGGLAGLFILAVFTRRTNGTGALVGAGLSAAALYLVKTQTDVHFFLYAGVGLGTCVLAGYLASLFLPGPTRDLTGLTVHTLDPQNN
jgi:SSS family transporter